VVQFTRYRVTQQHLEDAKEGLLEREGAGIGEKWRMLHMTELLV
jgi:hypothetical protein